MAVAVLFNNTQQHGETAAWQGRYISEVAGGAPVPPCSKRLGSNQSVRDRLQRKPNPINLPASPEAWQSAFVPGHNTQAPLGVTTPSGFPFSDALQLRAHVRQPGYSGGVACRRADAVWATASKAMVAAMTISPVFMVKSSNAVGGVGDRETCRTFVPHGLWQTRDTANHWILCQSLMIGLRAHNASLS